MSTLKVSKLINKETGNEINLNELENIKNVVDNLNSQDGTKALSAKQGNSLKEMIENIPVTEIVDNVNDESIDKALSAKQGKLLNSKIDNINIPDIIDNLTSEATDKTLSAKQGKVLKDYIEYLKNESFVYTMGSTKTVNNGNFQVITTTPTYNINKNKKLKVSISVPARNDGSSWGGLYVNLNMKINDTWYNLGNWGYDGGIMHSKTASISTGKDSQILDIPSNVNGTDTSDYTVQIELTGRSYDGTTSINGSHDINKTTSGGNSRGDLATWGSNQNYLTVIVEELN